MLIKKSLFIKNGFEIIQYLGYKFNTFSFNFNAKSKSKKKIMENIG